MIWSARPTEARGGRARSSVGPNPNWQAFGSLEDPEARRIRELTEAFERL
jgi:hypothetical protein